MKKYLLCLMLSFILILTGCSFNITKSNTKEINDIKIEEGLTTYAFVFYPNKEKNTGEGIRFVVRYDKSGKLKKFEFVHIYDIDEEYKSMDEAAKKKYDLLNKSDKELKDLMETDGECSENKKLDYPDYNTICEVKNHISYVGVSMTDKTFESSMVNDLKNTRNYVMINLMNYYSKVETEDKAKAFFEEIKTQYNDLKLSDKDLLLIIANKKVN